MARTHNARIPHAEKHSGARAHSRKSDLRYLDSSTRGVNDCRMLITRRIHGLHRLPELPRKTFHGAPLHSFPHSQVNPFILIHSLILVHSFARSLLIFATFPARAIGKNAQKALGFYARQFSLLGGRECTMAPGFYARQFYALR